MILDRLRFTAVKLANGISVHHNALAKSFDYIDYSSIRIMIPVGHRHSVGGFFKGTFHFLEHMILSASEKYPEKDSFQAYWNVKGVYVNAFTSGSFTVFILNAPNTFFLEALEDLVEQILNPIFSDEGIEIERNIIANERKRQEKWYPGKNDVGQYIHTQLIWGVTYPLEQKFGSDEDLERITSSVLSQAQERYLTPEIQVVGAGGYNRQACNDIFSKIPTSEENKNLSAMNKASLKRVTTGYKERAFDSLSDYRYMVMGVNNREMSFSEDIELWFLLRFLSNQAHSPMWQWLRNEKGMVYSTGFHKNTLDDGVFYFLTTQTRSIENIQKIRRGFFKKLGKAVVDTDWIKREYDRTISERAYSFVEPKEIVSVAVDSIDDFGEIITESMFLEALERVNEPGVLEGHYQEFLANSIEFCAMPK